MIQRVTIQGTVVPSFCPDRPYRPQRTYPNNRALMNFLSHIRTIKMTFPDVALGVMRFWLSLLSHCIYIPINYLHQIDVYQIFNFIYPVHFHLHIFNQTIFHYFYYNFLYSLYTFFIEFCNWFLWKSEKWIDYWYIDVVSDKKSFEPSTVTRVSDVLINRLADYMPSLFRSSAIITY